jgi:hypothetical protein
MEISDLPRSTNGHSQHALSDQPRTTNGNSQHAISDQPRATNGHSQHAISEKKFEDSKTLIKCRKSKKD